MDSMESCAKEFDYGGGGGCPPMSPRDAGGLYEG